MASNIALVTGATGGIGRAIARALATDEISVDAVVLTGRDRAKLAAVEAEVRELGVDAFGILRDLRDTGAVDTILREAEELAGSTPSILVNNAGTAPTAKFDATDDALLEEVLDLHVRVPFALIRGALPAMRAAGRGTIVQLGSSAGLRGFAFTAAYTAAKHAMVGMTRALAVENGYGRKGIHAYVVCPGFVDTEITRRAAAGIAARGSQSADEAIAAMAALNRIGRMHTADEVGAAVAGLCRDLPRGCVYDLDRDPPQFVDE